MENKKKLLIYKGRIFQFDESVLKPEEPGDGGSGDGGSGDTELPWFLDFNKYVPSPYINITEDTTSDT